MNSSVFVNGNKEVVRILAAIRYLIFDVNPCARTFKISEAIYCRYWRIKWESEKNSFKQNVLSIMDSRYFIKVKKEEYNGYSQYEYAVKEEYWKETREFFEIIAKDIEKNLR